MPKPMDMTMTLQLRGASMVELMALASAESDDVASTWERTVTWVVEKVCVWPGEAGAWFGELHLLGTPI